MTFNPPVCSDDCSGVNIDPFLSQSDSACITKGTTKYALRVSDNCGNIVWYNATVTFVDNFAPVITGDFSDQNVTGPNAIPSYVCALAIQLGTTNPNRDHQHDGLYEEGLHHPLHGVAQGTELVSSHSM